MFVLGWPKFQQLDVGTGFCGLHRVRPKGDPVRINNVSELLKITSENCFTKSRGQWFLRGQTSLSAAVWDVISRQLLRQLVFAVVSFFVLANAQAQSGVMRAGTWSIETYADPAEGPGSRQPTGPNPLVFRTCMAQSFVDQDNYSNPDFSMGRPRRLGFECQLTAKSGGRTSASWSYACSRADGFALQSEFEVRVGEGTLKQRSTETISKDGKLWSKASVRIEGKLESEQCESGLQQLR